jgi:hypothetical protein
MQEMIDILLFFWGYTWTKGTYGPEIAYTNCQRYKHTELVGDTKEMKLTAALAKRNIEILRPVGTALTCTKKFHLNKRYFCPETFFESLAVIDSMCLLLINTLPEVDEPRYRVYDKQGCSIFNNMGDVSCCLDEAKMQNVKIRGLAFRNVQFCSLFPVHEQPNFAGDGAIEQFA